MKKFQLLGLALLLAGCGKPDSASTKTAKDGAPAKDGSTAAKTDDDPVMSGKTRSVWMAELKSKDNQAKLKALDALGSLGDKARPAVPALIELLKDENEDVRDSTLAALEKIRGPELKDAVPTATALLKDPACRNNAIAVLGAAGPDAKAAVPQLLELIKQKELREETRKQAGEALKKIDPEAAAKAGVK